MKGPPSMIAGCSESRRGKSGEFGDTLSFIPGMGHMSTEGHLQFSGFEYSLPWSKPFHPLLGKSLHCKQPLVGEAENEILNLGTVYPFLTFSVSV